MWDELRDSRSYASVRREKLRARISSNPVSPCL
jgi:hypothetical protein